MSLAKRSLAYGVGTDGFREVIGVVGIFPNVKSALGLITIRLIDETEDQSTARRYMNTDLLASHVVEKAITSNLSVYQITRFRGRSLEARRCEYMGRR